MRMVRNGQREISKDDKQDGKWTAVAIQNGYRNGFAWTWEITFDDIARWHYGLGML